MTSCQRWCGLLVLALCVSALPAEAGYVSYYKDTTTYDEMTQTDGGTGDGFIDHDKEYDNFGVTVGGAFIGRAGTANSQVGYDSFIAGLGLDADFGIEDFEHKGRAEFVGINPTNTPSTVITLPLRFDRLPPGMGSLPITATLEGIGQVATIPDVDVNSAGRFPVSIPVDGTQYFDTNFEILAFTITFDQPITGFGFFGTDLGDFDGEIVLDITDINGVVTPVPVPHERSGEIDDIGNFLNASLMFFGVTNTTPFWKVEFRNDGGILDRFGFDNLIVSQAEEVPEPGSLVLLASGLLCTGGAWRLRRKPRAAA